MTTEQTTEKKSLEDLYMEPDEVLTAEDYRYALMSQNAVNSIALINSLAKVCEKISQEAFVRKQGGVFRNSHPIIRLYLEQLGHLCGNDLDHSTTGGNSFYDHLRCGMTYATADRICRAKSKDD